MNKVIFFLFIFFFYLGILQLYSPQKKQLIDIKDQKTLLAHIFSSVKLHKNSPYSIILIDVYREGVAIKTSFIRLKIISPFHQSIYKIFKVTSSYYHYLKPYIGYEIIRQIPNKQTPQNILAPPGSSFVGNPILGYWLKKGGQKQWAFYRFYKHLYLELAWDTPEGSFRPNVKQYRSLSQAKIKNGSYIYHNQKKSLLIKTRNPQRQNLILIIDNLFGFEGIHTPFIAPTFTKRLWQRHKTTLASVLVHYYQVFLKPLNNNKAFML